MFQRYYFSKPYTLRRIYLYLVERLRYLMISKSRKNFSLLLILLLIAIGFTCSSIWLVTTVNNKRVQLERLVDQISLISNLELKIQNCQTLSENEQTATFKAAFKELTQADLRLETFPELAPLAKKVSQLTIFSSKSAVVPNFKPLEDSLQTLYLACISSKNEKRASLGMISGDLGGYWQLSHVLILGACLLSILLVIIGLVTVRSRQKLNQLQLKTSSFMNNVIDCIMVADQDGKITEYNNVAQSTFGYNRDEILGRDLDVLYAQDEKAENVKEALYEHGFYKGEIINIRKNGEHFVSFLSANIIHDENGNVVGTMGISRDITDQKRNEEEFQHIISNAIDIIYTTDMEGNVTYVNASGRKLLGYEEEDMMGRSFKTFIHPEYVEVVEKQFTDQFQKRSEESYSEFKILTKHEQEIWVGQNVKTTFSPIYPKMITGFFGIVRNLDSMKQAELNLKESERKYRELFDNSTDLIQSVDPNGKLLYVNESWKKTLGYTVDELVHLNFMDLVHDDSKAYCEELLSDLLKLGEINPDKVHSFRMIAKNGEDLVLKGGVSLTKTNGQVISLQTFLRNVTEQEKIEKALQRSEENFRLISDSLTDVFFLYNLQEKRYEYISEHAKDQLGADPAFFYDKGRGSYLETFVHADDRAKVRNENKRVDAGEMVDIEYRISVNGEERWLNEKVFPIKDKRGIVVSKSGICRDITEIKKAYQTIYNQNIEISQSILYAKNIQQSTLPTKDEVSALLPDSFVFYKAKDVLSGDLYIVDTIKDNLGNALTVFVVGDCTGHGVPGGVLSLLCSGLLTESLTNYEVLSPGNALDFVRSKLIRLFRSNQSKYILDGMDAAFCALDKENRLLRFAGANLSCYIVRGDEVKEYSGNRQHIGYSRSMNPFTTNEIQLEEGDQIYLTTDGYVDQFGGPKTKKFLKKRLTKLLLTIKDEPMERQGELMEEHFLNWKDDNPQTDDVAMIGVRV